MIHDEGSSKQPLFYRRDDHPHGYKWERRHSSVEDSTDVCCRKKRMYTSCAELHLSTRR